MVRDSYSTHMNILYHNLRIFIFSVFFLQGAERNNEYIAAQGYIHVHQLYICVI